MNPALAVVSSQSLTYEPPENLLHLHRCSFINGVKQDFIISVHATFKFTFFILECTYCIKHNTLFEILILS